MDHYFKGLLWMALAISTLPLLTCSEFCPPECQCRVNGAVNCSGDTITAIPQRLPVHTYTLMLNDTNMSVINELSLTGQNLLKRFSLTHSHLHTIHPRAFHVTPQLRSVKLSNNDLSTIPAQAFSLLTALEEIYLDGNHLEMIAPDMFVGLDELLILDLTRNKLTNLTPDIFDKLTNLHTLNLGRNSIRRFPPTIFQSLTKLLRLRIFNNELEVLEPGIFDRLVNLIELNLHQNEIASLPPKVFWSLRNLRFLTLSSNRLQAIPPKSFYNMPKLSKLTIYKNPLLSLPDELMGHMPDITDFYLFATNLTTVPGNLFANMSGLLRLNLHLNEKLEELPSDLFCCLPKLQKLSLRSNNLSSVHPELFSPLTTLVTLLLNDNIMNVLPEDIFQNLTGLVNIDLRNNKLKSLPGGIFLSNTGLRGLTLSGNPWDCTCAIRSIAQWIKHNERVVLDKEDVMCHSPMYHMLRTLSSLRDEEFSYCDPTTATSYFPTQSTLHELTPLMHLISTAPLAKSTTPETVTPSLKTTTAARPTESQSVTHLFHDILVVEQVPEYVHHNHHKGSVYVWFLPSDTDLVGFLMFCYIFLIWTGMLLILVMVYGVYRLSITIKKLRAECLNNEALTHCVIRPGAQRKISSSC